MIPAAVLLLALAAPPAPFVQTSAAGERLRELPPPRLRRGAPVRGTLVDIHPGDLRQTLEGIGGALTEASAWVLAQLPEASRGQVLDRFFGPGGAGFTLARVPVGACDFSVEGRFSYDDVAGDEALAHFSIAPDTRGFKGARDPAYALLPLVKDALAREPALRIVASPWTAPAWMKDNQDFYGAGRGGTLLPRHHDTFARYMVRYLQAYRDAGVPIWAVTPENEPMGNGGQWESMEFTAGDLARYVGGHLGPRLREAGLGAVRIIQFDHNRDAGALEYTAAMMADPAAAPFVWGTGVHWYERTRAGGAAVLDELRARWPALPLLHTEGCVDAISLEENAPGGAFLGWRNDAWWWSPGAADWGYRWAPGPARRDHPLYAPVHRYARELLEGLNHGLAGWIDWNIVLDRRGGPNHVGNYCAAPVMVDTATGDAYPTPLLPVLAHFSRYLRPGDRIVRVATPGASPLLATAALPPDGAHLTVIAFNPSPRPLTYTLQVGRARATLGIPANALQSLRIPLPGTASRPPTRP
ncbi:glycoside hydrolase family 30 protein [Mesoterricola silvestris]|uniref:Glycosyl hydrolase n=1 Tax=Mesoterricola silvestris TaxID=2927979 RepID=A0AA48H4S7_9BACT|nr:hypothetical protein [Mesoterricola silvestris]BDU71868.1 glycosyl hydrolase [Mesoterricola silvestris]